MAKLFGVIHLLPLPGAPTGGPGFAQVLERALEDTRALVEGGADGIIVENLGDAPFAATEVPAHTVAHMTRIAMAIRQAAPRAELGINVLRNDAAAALGIAAAVEAQFIRVNVHTGVMVTDQGTITGAARETLLQRRLLDAEHIAIAADVHVKHASPLGTPKLVDSARDTFYRGRAAALILSGAGTGLPTRPEDVQRVRAAVPEAPLWIGSGMTPDNANQFDIDVAIVGTWLHRNSDLSQPLDAGRVGTMREALR